MMLVLHLIRLISCLVDRTAHSLGLACMTDGGGVEVCKRFPSGIHFKYACLNGRVSSLNTWDLPDNENAKAKWGSPSHEFCFSSLSLSPAGG